MSNSINIKKKDQFYYRFILIVSFTLIMTSFLFNSPGEILDGLKRIYLTPSNLLTDFMAVGNVGSAFFNSGTMALFASLLIIFSKAEINGGLIGSFFNFLAFSFFGKTLYNFMPLLIGVYLYTGFTKQDFRDYVGLSLFAAGCGPMVSFVSFSAGLNLVPAIILAACLGLTVGFILPTFSKVTASFHKGFSVYNNGMALGIMISFIYSILFLFNIETPTSPPTYDIFNTKLLIVCTCYFVFLMFVDPILLKGKLSFAEVKRLFKESGYKTSYLESYSRSTVFFNMGLLGLVGLGYTLLSGSGVNGPILGGILTMVGFGAQGKNFTNVLPVMAGVFLAANLGKYDPSASSIITAGLFGTTLAPFSGYYGPLLGFLSGFLHLSLVTRSGAMHGGLVLYNNGFSGGIITSFAANVLNRFNIKPLEK